MEQDRENPKTEKNLFLGGINREKVKRFGNKVLPLMVGTVSTVFIIWIIVISLCSVLSTFGFTFSNVLGRAHIDYNIKNNCDTEYPILSRLTVSLCQSEDKIFVDIREYLRSKPTINGVYLSGSEGIDFMTYVPLIDYKIRNGS